MSAERATTSMKRKCSQLLDKKMQRKKRIASLEVIVVIMRVIT
jgi:hypothetical protein